MRKILISGIPGTGKTTVGAYLQEHHRFLHLDFERQAEIERFLLGRRGELLGKLATVAHDVTDIVISWGFLPETQLAFVVALRDCGFDWVWFDGNRDAARRAFLARGTSSLATFDVQLRAIAENLDLDQLRPRIVDPFTRGGSFRPVEEIAGEVLRSAQI